MDYLLRTSEHCFFGFLIIDFISRLRVAFEKIATRAMGMSTDFFLVPFVHSILV